jgi:hypothetical protein
MDTVACRSNVEYAETPVSLIWQGQRLAITQVMARWREPGGKGFRVQTSDGGLFSLLYNEVNDTWQVELYGVKV